MRFGDWAYLNGWVFFLYAFLGWCCEVVFAAVRQGRFVNRGFLCGPLCPIYGCGLIAVTAMLAPLGQNWLLILPVSAVLTTLIELIAGFLMEKLFHHRWWDYSKMPLNIGGYVCLPFSLIWGVACALIVRFVHPLTLRLIARIPHGLGTVLLLSFALLFVVDLVVTVLSIAKLNRRLAELDAARRRLRTVSDTLGAGLAEGAILIKQRLDARERRLLSAFPHMHSLRYAEALDALRERQTKLRERLAALRRHRKRQRAGQAEREQAHE